MSAHELPKAGHVLVVLSHDQISSYIQWALYSADSYF